MLIKCSRRTGCTAVDEDACITSDDFAGFIDMCQYLDPMGCVQSRFADADAAGDGNSIGPDLEGSMVWAGGFAPQ